MAAVRMGWGAMLAALCVVSAFGASTARAAAQPFFRTVQGQLLTGREYAVAAPLPDGRVLIAGGVGVGGAVLDSAEVFDPRSETFSATGSMTTARADAVAAPLPDGRVLVAGGYDAANELSTAEVYDPSTGTFSATGSMTTAHDGSESRAGVRRRFALSRAAAKSGPRGRIARSVLAARVPAWSRSSRDGRRRAGRCSRPGRPRCVTGS
jgi:hypothetical protein